MVSNSFTATLPSGVVITWRAEPDTFGSHLSGDAYAVSALMLELVQDDDFPLTPTGPDYPCDPSDPVSVAIALDRLYPGTTGAPEWAHLVPSSGDVLY